MSDEGPAGTGKIAEALAKAQGELGPVKKNKTVTVTTKSGSKYTFDYATLDGIIEHVRPALTKHGLWFVQTMRRIKGTEGYYEPGVELVTTLIHSSGEKMESVVFVPDGGSAQDFGSALTYKKRYALGSILGIASEEDDDANMADGNSIDKAETRQPKAKAAPKLEDVDKFADEAYDFLVKVTDPTVFNDWRVRHAARLKVLPNYVPVKAKEIDDLIKEVEKSFARKGAN